MEDLIKQLADLYKAKLSKHKATGKLESFTTSYAFNGKYFEVFFNLESYWKYLEKGTKPHFPPVEAIKKWITVKRLVPRPYNGKVPSVDQMAYVISRSISKKGTPATYVLSDSLKEADDIISQICDELQNQLTNEINEEL